jgi:hypothetical protein
MGWMHQLGNGVVRVGDTEEAGGWGRVWLRALAG